MVRQGAVESGRGWADGPEDAKGFGELLTEYRHQWLLGLAFIVTSSWLCDKL